MGALSSALWIGVPASSMMISRGADVDKGLCAGCQAMAVKERLSAVFQR